MPIVAVDDGEIYYEEHGAGPPLMMVAGLGGVGAYWMPNLARFAAHFRVILHDQRGTGGSSRVAVRSIGQMSHDAVQLMDHLGLEQAAWLGHSTGAAIGVDLALDHPTRISRLVINSSTTHGDAYRRKLFGIRRILHAQAGAAAYASFTTLLLYPPWYINRHAEALAAEEAKAAASIADPAIQASRLDAILAWDRRTALSGLAVPSLVICAEDDILTPIAFSEDFARLIPGARLHRLKPVAMPVPARRRMRSNPSCWISYAIKTRTCSGIGRQAAPLHRFCCDCNDTLAARPLSPVLQVAGTEYAYHVPLS